MNHQFDIRPNEYTGEGVVALCRHCGLEVDGIESEEVSDAVLQLYVEHRTVPTCEEYLVDEVHRL